MSIESVAARQKIVSRETGRWQATKLHKRETGETNQRHHTNAARVLVRVTDHSALSDLTKLHAENYAEHKRYTLPTVWDGVRLLPVGREFEHADMMRNFADRHNALVAAFLADYEAEAAQAPARLNGLYDASMWPSLAEVSKKFKFSWRYQSVPTDGSWRDWIAESVNAAEADLRERLQAALERVRDRCAADGKLYATVFDSVRDLVALVPDMDVSGNLAPVVQAMQPLATLHADTLRDDETGRKEAAQKASSILSVLGGIK